MRPSPMVLLALLAGCGDVQMKDSWTGDCIPSTEDGLRRVLQLEITAQAGGRFTGTGSYEYDGYQFQGDAGGVVDGDEVSFDLAGLGAGTVTLSGAGTCRTTATSRGSAPSSSSRASSTWSAERPSRPSALRQLAQQGGGPAGARDPVPGPAAGLEQERGRGSAVSERRGGRRGHVPGVCLGAAQEGLGGLEPLPRAPGADEGLGPTEQRRAWRRCREGAAVGRLGLRRSRRSRGSPSRVATPQEVAPGFTSSTKVRPPWRRFSCRPCTAASSSWGGVAGSLGRGRPHPQVGVLQALAGRSLEHRPGRVGCPRDSRSQVQVEGHDRLGRDPHPTRRLAPPRRGSRVEGPVRVARRNSRAR